MKASHQSTDGPWLALVQTVKNDIEETGYSIVRGFSDSSESSDLLRLAASLGRPAASDVVVPDQSTLVSEISPLPEAKVDSYGFPILSTTSDNFDLHTDEYFEEHPSDIVLMQCVRQAQRGGDTLIARVADLLPRLSGSTIERLKEAIYPTHFGYTAILTMESDSRWRFRYNRTEIERSCTRLKITLPVDVAMVLDAVDRAIMQVVRQFRLNPGDLLVLDNTRTLHGRTAFTGDRLVLRAKAYI